MSTQDGQPANADRPWFPDELRPSPPSDARAQFARLFGHALPKRKRRKHTLRDGESLVSKARGG